MGATGASVTVIQLNDRGDPAAFDFTEVDLTMDNTWRDLDLSSIVADPDASWALLRVVMQDSNIGRTLHFRKNGNVNAIAIQGQTIIVADQDHQFIVLVPCDTGRRIEYRASAAIASVDIAILGWVA